MASRQGEKMREDHGADVLLRFTRGVGVTWYVSTWIGVYTGRRDGTCSAGSNKANTASRLGSFVAGEEPDSSEKLR